MADSRLERWNDGERYELYMGRWSRRIAPHFLTWLAPKSGLRWLDVGCGSGALCHAILEQCDPAEVVGVDRSEGFVAHAAAGTPDGRASFHSGDAAALPVDSGGFDMVVSGLMLNFVEDVAAVLAEKRRAAVAGGSVALYVWDYAEGMEWLRRFWDAAITMDPSVRHLDQAERFPICRPAPLREAFEAAGLTDVAVAALDDSAEFTSFADYWAQFASGGTYPAPAWLATRTPEEREAIRQLLEQAVPVQQNGTVRMRMRAWAVRGTAP